MSTAGRRTRANFARSARKIERYSRGVSGHAVSGLRQIGEEVMTDVKAARPGRGVPVDTGALRASGEVEGPRADRTVLLGFGDASSGYALIQHERLDFVHPVGEARYLVRGLDRWLPGGSSAMRALREQVEALGARIGAGL